VANSTWNRLYKAASTRFASWRAFSSLTVFIKRLLWSRLLPSCKNQTSRSRYSIDFLVQSYKICPRLVQEFKNMAEVLGVTSGVAGLLTLADAIFSRGYELIRIIKDAEESITLVLSEVNSFAGILHRLNNVTLQLESNTSGVEPTLYSGWLYICVIGYFCIKTRVFPPTIIWWEAL